MFYCKSSVYWTVTNNLDALSMSRCMGDFYIQISKCSERGKTDFFLFYSSSYGHQQQYVLKVKNFQIWVA